MQVLVRNCNQHPYKETFREKLIEIPAGEAIEMEQHEAVLFLGTFNTPVLDHDGNQTAAGFKMLKIESIDGAKTVAPLKADIDPNLCAVCKYKAASVKDLEEHAASQHGHLIAKDEEAEAAIKSKKTRSA